MSRSKHQPRDCLHDIVENAERIADYTDGIGSAGFMENHMVRDAVERCIERICEASYRLGDRAQQMMPDQPWADIRGMGNRLRHGYDRLDARVIWVAASERVPSLARAARAVLDQTNEGESNVP